jgi:3-phosphoshikimate 1-carboxyvinyltransferase
MALPDLIEIVPLTAPVRAEITVPGSKSITNRALILAALADGETVLRGALWSEDTQIMVECLQELGFMVNVETDPTETCNRTITVYGTGGAVPPGGTEAQPLDLFVGNAGTAARFLAPFLCLGSGVYRLHGVKRMHERPQAALFSALRELGYRIESENENDKLPAIIFAGTAGQPPQSYTQFERRKAAPATPKKCRVSIEESSQFASALLLSSKIGGWEIEIVGENAEESPYVEVTTKGLIIKFGVWDKTTPFQIESDASSSSYFKAAGWLLAKPGDKTPFLVQVIEPSASLQFDIMFGNYFQNAGQINLQLNETLSREKHLGDSIMTAIVMAPFASHTSKFADLGRLRVQECERVVALRTELTKCGAKVVEEGDTLTVYPSKLEELHGAEIETYNDHRMAMCFAVLGLKVPGIKIKNPACVKKTFPNFFQKLAAAPPHGLGATILDAHTGRKLTHEELFAD